MFELDCRVKDLLMKVWPFLRDVVGYRVHLVFQTIIASKRQKKSDY